MDTTSQLVESHLHLARVCAKRACERMPLNRDEAVAAATLGLWQAAKSYDPNRGVRFDTYATRRCYGQIIDDLRESKHWFSNCGRHRQGYPTPYRLRVREERGANHSGSGKPGRHREDRELAVEDPALGGVDEWDAFMSIVNLMQTRAERLLLILYYGEDMTMKEIGRTIGVSESTVSLMRTSIMKRLRALCTQRMAA